MAMQAPFAPKERLQFEQSGSLSKPAVAAKVENVSFSITPFHVYTENEDDESFETEYRLRVNVTLNKLHSISTYQIGDYGDYTYAVKQANKIAQMLGLVQNS